MTGRSAWRQQQTERGRLELLRTDLEFCQTLVSLVESELKRNNHKHAARTLSHATRGYVVCLRIFSRRRSWEDNATNEITEKLAGLRRELNRLEPLVQARSGT